MTPFRTRPGFTLIELLVVIAIIATLMGLLIPSIGFVKDRAKKAKTRTFLAQIEAALSNYKNVNGIYPESEGGSPDPAKQMSATDYATNADWLYEALESVDRENFRAGDLKDPYGHLIHYRPAKTLPFTPGAAAEIDSDKPPGADSYQLWSIGSNGRDDVSASATPGEYGDDIVTWK